MLFLSSAKSVQSVNTISYHRCGDGLYLQLSNKGTKSWIYSFKNPVTKKQREMGLGPYKFVDLAMARQQALENNQLVLNGKDPIRERKASNIEAQIAKPRKSTFKELVEKCIASKSHKWSNTKTAHLLASTPVVVLSAILARIPALKEYKGLVKDIDLTKFKPPSEKPSDTLSVHF